VLLFLGPKLLPEYKDPDAGRLDIPSAGLALLAVLAVIFALKEVAQDGVSLLPLAAVAVGSIAGVAFVRRQRGLSSPLVDLEMFKSRVFNVSLATNVIAIFIAIGYFLFVAQYLQLVVGLTPFEAGLWSLPSAAGFVAGSTVAPRFIHRVRPGLVIGVCMAIAAIGLGLLARVGVWGDLNIIVGASVLIALALAPVFNLTTELIVSSAPPEKAGAASGISETGAEMGGAMGLAILGSLGTAIYRSRLSADLPTGLPADAVGPAVDTLGGATAVASRLPDSVGEALLTSAQDAFTTGLQVTAAVSALIAIVVAVPAVLALRKVGPRDAATDEG
jgi:DHA2 family multidrug resistance protein-like MFS transporter